MQEEMMVAHEQHTLPSRFLEREVTVDLYPPGIYADSPISLLLINDGQDLFKIKFDALLHQLWQAGTLQPVLAVGIHAGEDRKMEYGTACMPDYENRGRKAPLYSQFIIQELIPHIQNRFGHFSFKEIAIAGFSLGGLTALDIVWNYPHLFSLAGVFSGSLWWRKKALTDGYNEETDRIMHAQVRNGKYTPGLRFYFTTGSLDETADRNNNGIIDSIDDTLGLIKELEALGYRKGDNIEYINMEDGRHDVETWGRALTPFLVWGWGTRA